MKGLQVMQSFLFNRREIGMEMKKLGFGTMRMPLHNPEDPTSVEIE